MMHPRPNAPVRWKASRFITLVDLREVDILLLYGGLAGRLIEVPGPYRPIVETLLEDPNSPVTEDEAELQELLRDQGILVPEEWDEITLLKRRYDRSRSISTGALGLTICPTLSCNFRCTYCYQHHPAGIMSTYVQNRIVDFVEQNAPSINTLAVTWFGGEPLLVPKVIRRLSEHFISLQNRGIDYEASIVTNGWLLTSDTSRMLVDLHVKSVQVTLDGPRDIHDARRPLLGNRPTFDTIIKNLASADPRLRISVRVNTDLRNIGQVDDIFDQLDIAGLQGRVSIYFAPVTPYTQICADISTQCIAGRPWSRLQAQLQLTSLDRGYGGPGLPRSKGHVCIADSASGMVIVPSGLVFKCWNDVTFPEKAVYNLSTAAQTARMKENQERLINWNPFNFQECVDCPVLPLCMGGCPHLGIQHARGSCRELKHNLRETLATYYLAYKRKKAANRLVEVLHQWIPEVIPDPGG